MALVLLVAAANPTQAEAAAGKIVGRVEAPDRVADIAAVDRTTDKKYPGTLDPASGRFTVDGLPLVGAFDILIDDREGARLEGINLKVPPSDYEEEQPLAPEDIATIKEQVRRLNQFEDRVDILAVAGNVQHAAVLINKLRTRPFVNAKPGEVVWRCELWRFERPEETWVKVQDELFLVLYRQRIPVSEYEKKSVTFDPALGGLSPTQEAPAVDVGLVKLPSAKPGVCLRPAREDSR
ncbi:MAG: hypothetical protein P4L84_15380 [Isosphaeraceae bacterium]|nr:hypothetical protein [Isosphaeraceae bacterium]